MCGEVHLLLQKVDSDIMFLSLIIILIIVGFILWNIVMTLWEFTIYSVLLSKPNILLLSNVFDVTWVLNMHLIDFLNCLLWMGLSIKPLVLIPQNKMVLQKENIDILLKLHSLSYYLPMFLGSFGGEAILTVVHLINRIPSSNTSSLSPFEQLYCHARNYSVSRVFGSTCFFLRPHIECSKLTSRFALCVSFLLWWGSKGISMLWLC